MLMSPARYKTYVMARPLRTHWRQASCEDVDCQFWRNGWTTTLDESTTEGKYHADTIRALRKKYRYATEKLPSGLTQFTFPAGQTCFQSKMHRQQLEKEPLFLVKGGDWRGNPTQVPRLVHRNGQDWADDFGEHLQTLAEAIERG